MPQDELLCLAVEHGDAAAMWTWKLGCHVLMPSQLPCVDSPGDLHILKDTNIHVC